MPPKNELVTLIGKRNNVVHSFQELIEEFHTIFDIQPSLDMLSGTFNQLESKYRSIKKFQESIADKLLSDGSTDDERVVTNQKIGDELKEKYLDVVKKYGVYQKELNSKCSSTKNLELVDVTVAIKEMVKAIESKPSKSGLERLPVPSWDGHRRSYGTWKKEFNHWMQKYNQDDDEKLQRFRKAMPKSSWWTEQTRSCKTIEQAWSILDIEFADQRKLMDELLKEIVNLKPLKRDAKSFTQYATILSGIRNDMEDNGYPVSEASEAPFLMSQLLSKLDARDNTEFGREMKRQEKEENISNLINWLHEEAGFRSRGRQDSENHFRSVVNTTSGDDDLEPTCPLGCTSDHPLAACSVYQGSTVDQRWEVVKQENRCRKCLRSHHTRDCKKPDGTSCDKCKRNHHRSLHNVASSPSTALNTDAPPFTATTAPSCAQGEITEFNTNTADTTGICPVQMVKVCDSHGQFVELLAMLDSGSNTSLLSKGAARKLRLVGTPTRLSMNLAGGGKRSEDSEILDITTSSPTDDGIEKMLSVFTVTKPCSAAKTVSKKSIERFPHLKPLSSKLYLAGGTIDLLIGTDFADAFVDIHTIPGNPGEPIAKRNCFGWYVLGQVGERKRSEIQSIDVGTADTMEDIKKLLHQDLLGIKPTQFCTCNDDVLQENKFVKSLSESTKVVDGRIQVRMPWKEKGPPKNSNYHVALKRMFTAEKSFIRKDCFTVVDKEVQDLLDLGFVSKINPEEVDHTKAEWYMPLQAVFTPEKTTKVRLVFDSSAKGPDGLSLNDHLEKGPNYINELNNVLTAWRWDEVAFAGDIRKMFNQVLIHTDDRKFHRFLWRSNIDDVPSVYQWSRLNFGDKPAPGIASSAINTLAKISETTFPEAARELRDHTYVDDIAGSKPSVNEVGRITGEIDAILEKGSFQIKVWHSNSTQIDQTSEEKVTDLLGHRWKKKEDVFSFKKSEIINPSLGFSKRNCLGILAQLWDPIGLVSPVTIRFRIDLQELWSLGLGWDDPLPEHLQKRWNNNSQVLNHLLTFEFSRKLKPQDAIGHPEVHGFCDGGEQAFGAVIYLRWGVSNGEYCVVPITTKAFVAPLKSKSIPRLELLGCLALTRMYESCRRALAFAKFESFEKVLWVDSTTVLSWIQTPPRKFRPFVSVRVAEIQETVGTEDFNYIDSKSNPADALTRGIDSSQLSEWSEGPSFLKLPKESWPDFDDGRKPFKEHKDTLKEQKRFVECAANKSEKMEENPILTLLTERCSTFPKVRRTLAYVRRFVDLIMKKKTRRGPLSVIELKNAENQLYSWCQVHVNQEQLDRKLLVKEHEDHLLRAHGRLEDIKSLPEEMRNPIILPKNHLLVQLVLQHLHDKRRHCGYQSLMSEARKRYWIIGLRAMSKSLCRKCVTCRKIRGKPLEQQLGQIPNLRAAQGSPVFSNTALDMFGPFQIRLNRKTLKEAQIIIFTCMTSRAVHLELVSDKSTETFLMAFRRFACLRGHPSKCWSDCGTNFVGAQDYLKEIMMGWDIQRIQNVLAEEFSCEFQWKWNVPKASHQNGVVESLIKSVRQAINAVVRNQAISEEQWRTLLVEISYVVNSRPLYPSSNDIWESPPITPNDILLGNHISPPQPAAIDKVSPRDLLRSTQNRVQEFWNCWIKYFSPNLLPRNKWFRPRENAQSGDLVLMLDPNQKRSKWEMALVTEVFPGQDGLVRKVKVKTKNGVYERPIHKLCMIATKQELASTEH